MIYWRNIKPELLYQPFRIDVEKLLSESKYSWYVTDGYRSPERSDQLYEIYLNGGPKAAPGGLSAHNWGLAIDVSLDGDDVKEGNQPTWNAKAAGWIWLWATIAKHPRLSSGIKFGDGPHIQRYNWKHFRSISNPEYYDVFMSRRKYA